MILILSHKKGKIIIVYSGKQEEYLSSKAPEYITISYLINAFGINSIENSKILKNKNKMGGIYEIN